MLCRSWTAPPKRATGREDAERATLTIAPLASARAWAPVLPLGEGSSDRDGESDNDPEVLPIAA
jgi:hypothetical protein